MGVYGLLEMPRFSLVSYIVQAFPVRIKDSFALENYNFSLWQGQGTLSSAPPYASVHSRPASLTL